MTDPSTWLSAASCGYGSGYEPGSQWEPNPDCPQHGQESLDICATPIYAQMAEEQFFRQSDRWWYENGADLMLFETESMGGMYDGPRQTLPNDLENRGGIPVGGMLQHRWYKQYGLDLKAFGYNRDGSAFDYYKSGEDAIYNG